MTEDETRKVMYPLRSAIWDGDVGKFKTLLPTIDRGLVFANGARTLLGIAAQCGNLAVVELLLAGGANPDAADEYDMTALHGAAESGALGVAAALLKNGANPNLKSKIKGCTPLYIAAAFNRKDVVELLIFHGADLEIAAEGYGGYTPLHQAANNGHKDVVASLLVHGANVNAKDDGGSTPFSLAKFYADRRDVRPQETQRHKDVVALLRSYGAEISG